MAQKKLSWAAWQLCWGMQLYYDFCHMWSSTGTWENECIYRLKSIYYIDSHSIHSYIVLSLPSLLLKLFCHSIEPPPLNPSSPWAIINIEAPEHCSPQKATSVSVSMQSQMSNNTIITQLIMSEIQNAAYIAACSDNKIMRATTNTETIQPNKLCFCGSRILVLSLGFLPPFM